MFKFLIFTFIFVFKVKSNEDDFYGFLETICVQKGGLCILKSECVSPIGDDQSCPEQTNDGFVCCAGVAKNDHRCRMHGGECTITPDCNPNLIYKGQTDCEKGQVCCILE